MADIDVVIAGIMSVRVCICVNRFLLLFLELAERRNLLEIDAQSNVLVRE